MPYSSSPVRIIRLTMGTRRKSGDPHERNPVSAISQSRSIVFEDSVGARVLTTLRAARPSSQIIASSSAFQRILETRRASFPP